MLVLVVIEITDIINTFNCIIHLIERIGIIWLIMRNVYA